MGAGSPHISSITCAYMPSSPTRLVGRDREQGERKSGELCIIQRRATMALATSHIAEPLFHGRVHPVACFRSQHRENLFIIVFYSLEMFEQALTQCD